LLFPSPPHAYTYASFIDKIDILVKRISKLLACVTANSR
jgi:hypothetical protein